MCVKAVVIFFVLCSVYICPWYLVLSRRWTIDYTHTHGDAWNLASVQKTSALYVYHHPVCCVCCRESEDHITCFVDVEGFLLLLLFRSSLRLRVWARACSGADRGAGGGAGGGADGGEGGGFEEATASTTLSWEQLRERLPMPSLTSPLSPSSGAFRNCRIITSTLVGEASVDVSPWNHITLTYSPAETLSYASSCIII